MLVNSIQKLAVVPRLVLALIAFSSVTVLAFDNSKPHTAEETEEKDWVDGRVSRMDTGQFFSSILPTPGGVVRKGLSIRLGETNAAAVCYDTADCSLRTSWTGKFLEFDATRYGLLNSPKVAGETKFNGKGNAWSEKVQFRGFYLNGKRVVLSYGVGDVEVLESPWFQQGRGSDVFTRTFTCSASAGTQTVSIAVLKEATGVTNEISGMRIVALQSAEKCVAAAVTANANVKVYVRGNELVVKFPPRRSSISCDVYQWSGPFAHLNDFAATLKASKRPQDLGRLAKPGAPRWGKPLETHGEVERLSNEPYVVDTLTVPYQNPYNALMFLSGVDFFRNGDAAVCSIHGDVWLVRGITDDLQTLQWKRFATGLFQPLGLKIIDDKVYVLGRDRITILHDRNNDGEADFYESFCDKINTSEGGHDYVTSLEKDSEGALYYVDPLGVHRVSKDGKSIETIATGWRNPNGMGVGPNGVITVAPQEGNWTPTSAICEVKPGGFYGMGGPQITSQRPLGYDPPLCWIPRAVDNSSGSQVWVTSDKWGPLKNEMLSLSFGRCSMMLVLRETVDGIAQGGVVPLKPRFSSGAVRGAFRNNDGQLYVVGSLGWATSATRDGCFQRVRYTGKKVYLPTGLHVVENGIHLTFSEPLDPDTASDAGSYAIEQWNYLYSKEYGSQEYSVSRPDDNGRDTVDIKSAKISNDHRSVFLEVPGLKPVMQMRIQYNVNAADGKTVRGEIYNTINKPASADKHAKL